WVENALSGQFLKGLLSGVSSHSQTISPVAVMGRLLPVDSLTRTSRSGHVWPVVYVLHDLWSPNMKKSEPHWNWFVGG
ncbi:MAG: hypothetical protein QNL62_12305, partial [Gammaproteobacteria bacterium]|nr:hypothetical protein [Gammaproteobacteria bacterium]